MRQPPVLDQQPTRTDDEEAEYQAVMARRHAGELVRNHLETHSVNNPGASSDYVTWIATLHPENADITIDHRFFIPGNPWWTIYEDTKNQQQIPTATAVQVTPEEDEELHQPNRPSLPNQRKENGTVYATAGPSFFMTCSPVNLFAGFLVASQALLGVLLCEFLALILCHFPAALFYHLAQAFSPENVFTGLFYSFFMILYWAFALCDSIVLLVSVILTEVLAVTAFLVGAITGGIIWGLYWHQQVRRMCHGVRVMFRQNSSGSPSRHFFFVNQKREEAMEQQNTTAEVVSVPVHHEYYQTPQVQVGASEKSGLSNH